MANPLILHENILANAAATLSLTGTTAAAGFPVSNITDWRMGTAYRYKDSDASSAIFIDLDAGAGNTLTADTLAIGGHNLKTANAQIGVRADTFTPPTTARLSNQTITADLPELWTFTESTFRYWRVFIQTVDHPNDFDAVPQIGIITLGRRIDFTAGALPDLDPYHRSSEVEPFINNNGSPIGVNVRHQSKRFTLNYGSGDPGMTRDDFFAPAAGISFDTDFLPHAVDNGNPFWFAWNIDVDAGEVYLCRIDGPTVSMPFVDSTARRGLQATFIAHREIS